MNQEVRRFDAQRERIYATPYSVRPELVEGPYFLQSRAMGFWVYLLHCRGGSYYAGHTDNLDVRLAQHEAGTVDGFTSDRLPIKLVRCGELPTRHEAIALERRIKGWSRAKKMALIRGDWEKISALAKKKNSPSTSSGRTE